MPEPVNGTEAPPALPRCVLHETRLSSLEVGVSELRTFLARIEKKIDAIPDHDGLGTLLASQQWQGSGWAALLSSGERVALSWTGRVLALGMVLLIAGATGLGFTYGDLVVGALAADAPPRASANETQDTEVPDAPP